MNVGALNGLSVRVKQRVSEVDAVEVYVGTGRSEFNNVRLPSSSGHPICADLVSVGEDVHCESTAQEIHAGVPA